MNEAILKWLASAMIGMVVCGSLWLAGNVQHEVAPASVLGRADASSQQQVPRAAVTVEELHLAAARRARAEIATTARTAVSVN